MKGERGLVELIRARSAPIDPLPIEPEARLRLARFAPPPRRPEGYKAVLFDVYGTLFVSGSGDIGTLENGSGADGTKGGLLAPFALEGDLPRLRVMFAEAVKAEHRRLREAVRYPEIRVEALWARLLGLKDPEAAREFALRFELTVNPVFPMPGLAEILARLRAAEMPMGIVSNAQFFTPLLFEAFLDDDLAALGFRPGLCVFSYREGEAKPSPRLFERAAAGLAALGIRPSEALFIGNDMRNDVLASREAGFAAGLFAGDGRSLRLREGDPRCAETAPDRVIMALSDIPGAAGLTPLD